MDKKTLVISANN